MEAKQGDVGITEMPERVSRPDPVVMAYDIETTKSPLKFPDSSVDKIMMISYMIDGQGYLITNREIVSQDIDDFEYTPKPEYPGNFIIFNEGNEKDVLIRFFEHIREEKPTVIATFNGDFFDWPFVDARAQFHGLDLYQEIGFQKDSEDEYKSGHCVHMDCFRWVKRDSYLPQGSQGLKAVTTAKLGYNPLEIDPELMTPYASEKPQVMAEYSVSDAVATYYLYMKYVHPFIFSLCNIIPLNPDEVLRKGTGTLCEMLLMVQAYNSSILLPNKHKEPAERFYNGHLLESETYVGGHVESLEAGVFRSDIPATFNVDTTAIDELLEQLDRALKFSIEVEAKKNLDDVENYDEVRDEIAARLYQLKDKPKRDEKPSIYHVDVASMYPNIMTTNRLQPDSMVSEEDCAACDFNRPGKTCDRRLPWSWRGEFFPPKKEEYLMIRESLSKETFPPTKFSNVPRTFDQLSVTEQASYVKKRLTEYSKKVYSKIKQTETIEREAIICQRENPFYVNTVRSFRDRRYEFKGLCKVWKKKVDEVPAGDAAGKEEAKKMIVLYDSLQLAHKVILNSFYGYVMRKGSRWYSMEMAGVTCLTGATIIQLARSLVERLGRPLELDTDGIWCILPGSFPEDFTFKLKDGKKLPVSYPCVMLNHLVHEKFTNHQYQTLADEKTFKYETHSDNSIFFEVDGPYKAMILPTSKEEDKGLKKRYAVFNDDGSLAELKGFEIKRRGELRLIKAFQSQVFKVFLDGSTLEECYNAVASVANSWLDILMSHGSTLEDSDLIDLISENRSMSKTLDEYEGQKSTSICTARRLAEFLGSQMVKDKGLACKYIISKKPLGSPVTERAIPVEIFSAEYDVKSHYLKKWLKDPSITDFDPRAIIDWDYYTERLGSTVQKIITIPAAYQGVDNPVPRLPHPDWLNKRIAALKDKKKQRKIGNFFNKSDDPMARFQHQIEQEGSSGGSDEDIMDIEDIADQGVKARKTAAKVTNKRSARATKDNKLLEDPIASLPAVMPDPQEDYSEWLKYQKQKWKVQKQARERRHHLFGESGSAKNNTGLTGMFRNQAEKAYSSSWNILQYRPSDVPGQVRAFVFINNKIQAVRINIQRRVFVNFKTDQLPSGSISDCTVTKVNHTLPNGHSSVHLFKLEMPEDTYQEEMAKADSILKHHSVEGIYESQVEFDKRALLDIGTQCTLDDSQHGLLGKGLEHGFNMNWLIPKNQGKSSAPKYLENASLNYIHVQHISSRDLQIISVIPTWSNMATIFVSRPSSQAQHLPNMKKMYSDEFVARGDSLSEEAFKYQEALDFDVQYFENLRTLYRKVGTYLSKLHSEKNTRAIVSLQSAYPERLQKLIRPVNDFPIVEIRSSGTIAMSLNWQRDCAKRVLKSYFSLGQWLSHLTNLANYSNVPLGNLKADDTSYLIDIMYARKLQESNIVLWWSPSPMPDNGGCEKDSVLPSMDSLDLPIVNNPGLYSKICVELEIRNLSINTILTASIINEAEGTAMAGTAVAGDNNEITSFVENSFSTPALSVLSTMVKGWWNEAVEENLNADMMVNSFLKWIASPESYLYDRSLYYHVQNLSKKAFVQLVKEFRKLGSTLVYADQNRVLIATTKTAIENTYAFSNYVVKSIRSKSLFSFLDIDIKEYWDTLLWMDDVNYGGRGCQEIPENLEDLVLNTYLNWHVKKFLPPMLQTELEDWIIEFLQRFIEVKEEQSMAHITGSQPRSTPITSTALQRAQKDKKTTDIGDEEYLGKGLLKNLEKPLLKRVRHLLKRYHDGASNPVIMEEFTTAISAGSVEPTGNVITMFIKMLCAVYGLSQDFVFENQLLKRHLLDVVEVREFSAEAEFKNPSASLKLPQVICENCSYVRDLDFCRNDDLARKETNGATSYYAFACENCGKDYKRVSLEERLVQEVQRFMTLYQVQDLRCDKCKKTREYDLSEHCECSGSWVETIPRDEVMKTVNIYKHVADFYDFKLLQDLLSLL